MNERILPLIALAIAALVFFFYVGPTWSGSIATTKEAIAFNNQALEAAKQYTAQQNDLASKRNAIEPANLEQLATFLPNSVDNVGVILDLNALAARSGFSFSSIDVISNSEDSSNSSKRQGLPAAGTGPTGSIDLSLSAVGSYNSLQAFLAGVERSARLLDVRDLVIRGSATGVYNYQMTLRLYWLR